MVSGMASRKLLAMDVADLRGWAQFMDKAVIVSLVVLALAAVALGLATWLSTRFNSAFRTQESAAFDRYKAEAGRHMADLEQQAASARERSAELEKAVAQASERAAMSENAAAQARQRAASLEKTIEEANARAAQARPAPEASPAPPTDTPANPAANPDGRTSQMIASLAKFAGAKAAVYVVDEAPDAEAVGSSVNAILGDAGWTSLIWKWTGVGGIVGVVVLTKEGRDPTTDQAAAGLVGALGSAGYNAAKADWPADWRRYRGTLNGPQIPGPTDAPIRVVIGARAH
jgi:hypothetical protein